MGRRKVSRERSGGGGVFAQGEAGGAGAGHAGGESLRSGAEGVQDLADSRGQAEGWGFQVVAGPGDKSGDVSWRLERGWHGGARGVSGLTGIVGAEDRASRRLDAGIGQYGVQFGQARGRRKLLAEI